MVFELATAVYYFPRDWTAMTTQYTWVSVWNTFAGWLERCALPLAYLWTLLQPEVKRLWARPSGGFDVIPMAGVAGAAPDAGVAP